jgi:acyl-CoA thioester hydrolase
MQHDAWRRQPESYPFRGEVLPRYTDVDLWQHLNNVALISLHIESVQRLLLDVADDAAWRAGPAPIGPETTSTDFIAEAYYPTPLTAAARITHVSERDIGIASALFQKGHCVGLHQSRVVSWAPNGQPVPMAADLRAAFARRMAAQRSLPPGGEPESGHKPARSHPGDAAGGAPADSLHVLPRRPADFPAHDLLASRFGDHDATGRASDQALGRMAEQGRVNLLTALMGPERLASRVGFMVAHVSLRWLRRGRAPAAWNVGSGVLRSGDRSITIRAQLGDGDECHAVCDSVMVAIDREAQQSIRLPDDLRAAVQRLSVR